MEPARLLVAVLVVLAGASACAPPSADAPEEAGSVLAALATSEDAGTPPCPLPSGGTCIPESAPIPEEEACPGTRWIAVLPDGNMYCPPGPDLPDGQWGGWKVAKLFEESRSGWPIPPRLAPFCSYDWQFPSGAPPTSKQVYDLKVMLSQYTGKFGPDCQVVAPLGTSAISRAAWPQLHTDFHAQTGRLGVLPTGSLPGPAQVRVAVVDSSPHRYNGGDAVEDRLGHGHAMGRIIRELGCPDESALCIAQVANHLALPNVTRRLKDPDHGGYFGEQSRTAQAIHAAVAEWRAHNAGLGPQGAGAPKQPRLVINLSIGWYGRYGGEYSANNVGELPAPVRAVHAAITHAVCRGAAVIAAAGNDPGGPDAGTGPMYPAGWEEKPAPVFAACDALEGDGYPGAMAASFPLFPPAGSTAYRPLVHAVGALRADDRPLDSTRPGGRPRLAAPGAHALAVDLAPDGGLEPTDILTGTSVSTAVVSGILSSVWGYQPTLSAPESMEVVRKGSVDLRVPADFCVGGSPCPWPTTDPRRSIRRVSQCNALVEACKLDGGSCPPVLPPCTERPAYGSPLPQLSTEVRSRIDKVARSIDGSTLNVPLSTRPLPVCEVSALRSSVFSYEETICPFRQYYGIAVSPWTNPQPSKNPCSICLFDIETEEALTAEPVTTGTLYISIDSEYSSRSLDSPSLRLEGRDGGIEIDISARLADAGVLTLSGGDEIKLTGIPLEDQWLPITGGSLNLRGEEDGGAYSTSSELLLQ